jgi:ribose-phosphate pyrophosphokinase
LSPDEGRFRTATEYGQALGAPVAILHKRREDGASTRVAQVVGDVRDRPCLIIDDMISTGGTLRGAIEALLHAGARPEVYVAATHGLFVGQARAKLGHPAIRGIYVTDSVPLVPSDWPQLTIASLAPLLAAAIGRIHSGQALHGLNERTLSEIAPER